jgi:Tol biopolymer transport system component
MCMTKTKKFAAVIMSAVSLVTISCSGTLPTSSTITPSNLNIATTTPPTGAPLVTGTDIASSSAGSHQLVFSSTSDGLDSVYLINPDGSELTKITSGLTQYFFPVWSPIRQKFAVIAGTNLNSLYLMDYDGANLSLWVYGSADASISANASISINASILGPAWSPDGKKLVFSAKDRTSSDIYTITGLGLNEGLVKLTNTASVNENWPKWSPDGSRIAFQTQTITQLGTQLISTWGVDVMNADGTGRHTLMQGFGSG